MQKRNQTVKESIVRRTGDPDQRAAANRHMAIVGGLEDDLKKCQTALNDAERMHRKEQNKSVKVLTTLESARNSLSAAQEIIDADPLPEKAQPVGRIQQRDSQKLKVSQLEAAYAAQQRATTLAWEAVRTAEFNLFQADKKLNLAVDAVKEATSVLEDQAREDAIRAKKLAELEETRAKRWETEKKVAIKTREEQILDLQNVAEKQIAAAQAAHATAALKANSSNQKAIGTLAEAERLQKERWEHRVQAVLELRDNQNAVRAKAATDSEKRVNKIATTAKQLEEEKSGLLAKGINPYAEFRQREISAQDAATEKKLKDAVEQNKASLAVRLIREEDLRRQRDEAESIELAYEKKQRDELGRHVIEARNRDYIASVTVDGREILDPSGRASRIDPSQITSFPDYSLGLGKSSRITPSSMKAITEKIRQKVNIDRDDLGEYQRMLGPLKEFQDKSNNQTATGGTVIVERSQSAPSGDIAVSFENADGQPVAHLASSSQSFDYKTLQVLNTLGGRRGDMPGKGELTAVVNAQPEGELDLLIRIAEEENGALESADDGGPISTKSPKYKPTELSKFEKDCLERAKGKMKKRREEGTTQVAAGKTFQGDAFVSSPAVLEYKDFVVGKVYKKRFILTNVSYSFNSFQLLPLKDDIIDFFEIIYEKPGRMSAGVSCSLEIVFSPKVNEDIFGHVQLLSQTGPINIPLQCLKRRCIPRVQSTDVNFGDVVIGQIIKQRITIKNSGALPTKFTILPTTAGALGENGAFNEEEVLAYNSLRATDEGGSDAAIRPYGAGDPALNDAELCSRTRLVMTETLRKKKRERPNALAIEPSPGTNATLGGAEIVYGQLEGYSSIAVDVICAPLSLGVQDRQFKFNFEEVKDSDGSVDEEGKVVTKEQFVDVHVRGEDVSIFVADENIDFKAVLHNRLYRTKFVLKNRGKCTYRADIAIPSPMNKYVETSPNSLYVQAGGSQVVNVKFSPTPELLSQMSYFMFPNEEFDNTALMRLPVEIKVTNQDLPVYCVLNSTLTQSVIDIRAEFAEGFGVDPGLNFGKIYVNQTATRGLILKNSSALPQKIAFVRLKKEIRVMPNDGFAVLLPNESLTFDVTFSALSAIAYDTELQISTSQNDLYTVKVTAQGIECPFEISNAVIKLRSTCPGQRILESTMISNKTQKKQTFEMVIPNPLFSWIKVSPLICELAPGASKRLEFEFLPPDNILEKDPLDWHNDLMFPPEPHKEEKVPEPIAVVTAAPVKGKGGKLGSAIPAPEPTPVPVDKPVEPAKPKHTSPFTSWKFSDGWVMGIGPYGGIRWTKPVPSLREDQNENSGENKDENVTDSLVGVDFHVPDSNIPNESDIAATNSFASTAIDENEAGVPTPGYIGDWTFPLFVKPKGNKLTTAVGLSTKSSFNDDGATSLPVFLRVQSVVVANQYDVDTSNMDFGQISLGTRLIRTLKFKNNTTNVVTVVAKGLNPVGPFAILNAIRDVPPGEWISVVVECNPLVSGLFLEAIEFSAVNGGHSIRVPLRVQGVNPTVELSGLEESTVVGKFMDFGDVVSCDVIKKNFTITNTSAFPVAISIQRTVCNGLPPRKQAELVQRNMSGLPVFTFTPESVMISQGGKVDIELSFQPDRYRILPFREDLDISVGQGTNNLPIKVHLCGRSRGRQLFVTTASPKDEAFYNQDFGICVPEDPLLLHMKPEVRQLAKQCREDISAMILPDRPIVLEFPDPYRNDITQTEIDAIDKDNAEAATILGAAAKPDTGSSVSNLTQFRRVIISAAKINDARGASSSAMSYDVVIHQNGRDSGLFAVGSNSKGTLTPGSRITVPIGCTLPRPRGLGGLQVGSWQMYKADVVLKGGWKNDDDQDEFTVPMLLKAFVRL